MKKYVLILFYLLPAAVLHGQKMDFRWLTGSWKMSTGSGAIVETWHQVHDSLYRGRSVQVKGADTIPQESIEIVQKNGDWFYIPAVQGQNNNQPVPFKIIYQRGFEFISENPAHDFPQRIAYRRYLPMHMHASIEGSRNGKYAKQNFSFALQQNTPLFVWQLQPAAAYTNAAAWKPEAAEAAQKHVKFIDSLGMRSIVILAGNNGQPPHNNQWQEWVVLKAEDMDTARAILLHDPAVKAGIYTAQLQPYTMNSWFPGSYGGK